ncbi:hypothetical protein A2U01_0030546, partial [Trifolium medium]|nr:hypothetical protein [Trifolium medium]
WNYPLSFLGNDLSSTLLTVSMLPVAFNAKGTNFFEQVNDVDVLEQEDKCVSLMSRFLKKDKSYYFHFESFDPIFSFITYLQLRTNLQLQIQSSQRSLISTRVDLSRFRVDH